MRAISQSSEIHAYHVKDEILATLQNVLPLPEAAGTPHALDGNGSPVSKHAISQVIAGIEKQKQEDISILQSELLFIRKACDSSSPKISNK
jgi:hypothetical protein